MRQLQLKIRNWFGKKKENSAKKNDDSLREGELLVVASQASQSTKQSRTNFCELPHDVIYHIATFLDPRVLGDALGIVCLAELNVQYMRALSQERNYLSRVELADLTETNRKKALQDKQGNFYLERSLYPELETSAKTLKAIRWVVSDLMRQYHLQWLQKDITLTRSMIANANIFGSTRLSRLRFNWDTTQDPFTRRQALLNVPFDNLKIAFQGTSLPSVFSDDCGAYCMEVLATILIYCVPILFIISIFREQTMQFISIGYNGQWNTQKQDVCSCSNLNVTTYFLPNGTSCADFFTSVCNLYQHVYCSTGYSMVSPGSTPPRIWHMNTTNMGIIFDDLHVICRQFPTISLELERSFPIIGILWLVMGCPLGLLLVSKLCDIKRPCAGTLPASYVKHWHKLNALFKNESKDDFLGRNKAVELNELPQQNNQKQLTKVCAPSSEAKFN